MKPAVVMTSRLFLSASVVVLSCTGPVGYLASAGGDLHEGESFGLETEAVFRGIPYAAPPVGALRWKPPVPHQGGDSIRSALEFGPACVQQDRLADYYAAVYAPWGVGIEDVPHLGDVSEDCLSLNVWTSNWGGKEDPLPVMVWIHGGSNTSGWSSQEAYDGKALARKGAVVVTVNYRLGVFGFMAHPELSEESGNGSSGNYGLLDQIAALEWVRENISNFGGDPDRVTAFGESAGSSDVISLMASPLAEGFFHRAIAQSGAQMGGMTPLQQAERRGARIGTVLGAESISALRALDAISLDERVSAVGGAWGPIHDGWVLPDPPGVAFSEGRQHDIPLIIGSTADEFTGLPYYLPRVESTVTGYNRWTESFRGVASALREVYPVNRDEDVRPALIQIYTDIAFTCESRTAARRMRGVSNDAYLYQLTRVLEGAGELGAFHGSDIPYVFDTQVDWVPQSDVDRELTSAMMDYWVEFARTGDPNGDGRPVWPVYQEGTAEHLSFGDEIVVGSNLRAAKCDVLDRIGG